MLPAPEYPEYPGQAAGRSGSSGSSGLENAFQLFVGLCGVVFVLRAALNGNSVCPVCLLQRGNLCFEVFDFLFKRVFGCLLLFGVALFVWCVFLLFRVFLFRVFLFGVFLLFGFRLWRGVFLLLLFRLRLGVFLTPKESLQRV